MKALFVDEPELEFGNGGRHIDIRFGLSSYGAFDSSSDVAPKVVRLGVVGDSSSIDEFLAWVSTCRDGIEAKPSPLVTLFPAFPGFGEGKPFADIAPEPNLVRAIPTGLLDEIARRENREDVVRDSVSAYISELQDLFENKSADVAVCLLSPSLMQRIDITGPPLHRRFRNQSPQERPLVWHDYLKAKSLQLKRPIQVARPGTYGGKVHRYRQDGSASRDVEDEATRAWNFFTALYYKAGGTPWRLIRNPSDYATCYVGVSYYYDSESGNIQVSVAQVFNERGEGVVVRGGQASVVKDDRTVHLSEDASRDLVVAALELYRREHGNLPARVVCHKTSYFSEEEKIGFEAGLRHFGISHWDLMSIRKTFTRFFRRKPYPPLRGTAVELDSRHAVLYTQGSVDFYRAYPGLYVPKPLEVKFDVPQRSAPFLLREVLALTKMNWNSTRFVNAEPITVAAARNVGDVLRYVPTSVPIHSRYSHYI